MAIKRNINSCFLDSVYSELDFDFDIVATNYSFKSNETQSDLNSVDDVWDKVVDYLPEPPKSEDLIGKWLNFTSNMKNFLDFVKSDLGEYNKLDYNQSYVQTKASDVIGKMNDILNETQIVDQTNLAVVNETYYGKKMLISIRFLSLST